MITAGRHRPLAQDAWDELPVRATIDEIAADAIAHFHPDTFWPGHPSDDGVGDGNPSFYYGAAGVIWALEYLHRIGAARVADDFRPVLPKLLERTIANFESNSPADYAKHARCFLATWVPPFSPCALRLHRAFPIWFIGAPRQIMDCQSENSCGVCPARWLRRSTWPR